MNDVAPSPTQASVLYLRLADFGSKPVVEQARLRAQADAVVAAGLSVLPERDRILLDTPDGLAIVVLDNPLGALQAAERCLDAAAVLPLCIGAGHGAVAAVAGPDAVQGMIGDGLHSAGVAAGFAIPGQMLASNAFREAVWQQSPVRRADLQRAGTFSDASVRTHELFVLDEQARGRRRRRLAIVAAASLAVCLAGGLVGRLAYRSEGPFAPPAEIVLSITPGGDVFLDGEPRGSAPALTRLSVRAGRHTLEVRHGADPPLRVALDLRPGEQHAVAHAFTPLPVLHFDVTPGGEVFINGQSRGAVARVRHLELPEGTYAVEVRYGSYPPLKRKVQVRRGEQVAVKHVFAPAVVLLKVVPGGEVFVNGAARGSVASLKRLELAPGRYHVEIRFGAQPPLKKVLDVKAGQQVVIQHDFRGKSFFKRLFGSDG